MPFPFEVPFDEVATNLDRFVDAVFGALESEFLVMPRGDGFVDFPTFETGYERLKRETSGFREVTPEHVAEAVLDQPISLIVLRCMLGFTPPECAYLATRYIAIWGSLAKSRRSCSRHPADSIARRQTPVPGVRVEHVAGRHRETHPTCARRHVNRQLPPQRICSRQ